MRALALMLVSFTACGPLWKPLDSGVTTDLNAIHGFSNTDVWSVGAQGVVLHFDGTTWSKVASNVTTDLTAVWGAAPNDVWIAGANGTVLRWNGSALVRVNGPGGDAIAVRGTAANDVFFCTTSGLSVWNGSSYAAVDTGTSEALDCETLTVGAQGRITAVMARYGTPYLFALSGGAANFYSFQGAPTSWYLSDSFLVQVDVDAWLSFDFSNVTRHTTSGSPLELTWKETTSFKTSVVRGANDVWLAGTSGEMAHYDGTELKLKVEGGYSAPTITGLWASDTAIFASGTAGWLLSVDEPATN